MPIEKLRPTFTFTEELLKQLEQVVPEAFADGKVDWETLKEAMGEELEDGREEHFGLTWPGKREARKLASVPSQGTLVPCPGEGVNEDETENIFIEGENLEVLKLLQKSYAGKIKMIYIDPPYNTGNDFIYNDNFTDPLEAYLEYTGAKGESGELLTTNTRADGRFHSRWLTMMYPRLRLARQLLHEDGVIFISIDDNEINHLIQIMNEIFGEENHLTTFIWEKTQHFGRQKINTYSNVDYIVAYAKNLQNKQGQKARRMVERVLEDLEDAPLYNASNPVGKLTFPERSTIFNISDGVYEQTEDHKYKLLSSVTVKNGFNLNEFTLEFRSRWSKEKVLEEFEKGAKYWVKSENFAIRVIYQDDKTSLSSPRQLIFSNANNPMVTSNRFGEKVGTNEEGTSDLNSYFDINFEYMYPKPMSLISYLLSIVYDEDKQDFLKEGIILDFFAGSCSTAHAVLHNNLLDNSHNNFIVIQLPEPTATDSAAYHAGLENISTIGRERIKRVINKIDTQTETKSFSKSVQDLGFKVFQLENSNFINWQKDVNPDAQNLLDIFSTYESPLIKDWKFNDLFTEILLLEGFPLTSKKNRLKEILTNKVFQVSAPEFCDHELLVCLDETIEPSTIELLKLKKNDIVITLDSALSDEIKTQLEDRFNLHVI